MDASVSGEGLLIVLLIGILTIVGAVGLYLLGRDK
jgi:hypothetical protein